MCEAKFMKWKCDDDAQPLLTDQRQALVAAVHQTIHAITFLFNYMRFIAFNFTIKHYNNGTMI